MRARARVWSSSPSNKAICARVTLSLRCKTQQWCSFDTPQTPPYPELTFGTLGTRYESCTAPCQRQGAEKWQGTGLPTAACRRKTAALVNRNFAKSRVNGMGLSCDLCLLLGCRESRKLGEWRVARRSGYGEDVGQRQYCECRLLGHVNWQQDTLLTASFSPREVSRGATLIKKTTNQRLLWDASNFSYIYIYIYGGTAIAQWLRCCSTIRKVAGSIPAGVSGFFYWNKILPIALWPWGWLSL